MAPFAGCLAHQQGGAGGRHGRRGRAGPSMKSTPAGVTGRALEGMHAGRRRVQQVTARWEMCASSGEQYTPAGRSGHVRGWSWTAIAPERRCTAMHEEQPRMGVCNESPALLRMHTRASNAAGVMLCSKTYAPWSRTATPYESRRTVMHEELPRVGVCNELPALLKRRTRASRAARVTACNGMHATGRDVPHLAAKQYAECERITQPGFSNTKRRKA